MSPDYAICDGGLHDNERYPLPRRVEPGYVFSWDTPGAAAYQVRPEIIQTNRGPMWVARPVVG